MQTERINIHSDLVTGAIVSCANHELMTRVSSLCVSNFIFKPQNMLNAGAYHCLAAEQAYIFNESLQRSNQC